MTRREEWECIRESTLPRGIGIGTVMVAVDPDLTFEPHEVADSAAEKERYQSALSVFCEKTQAQADHMKETVGEAEAEIMSGHIVLAQDPGYDRRHQRRH